MYVLTHKKHARLYTHLHTHTHTHTHQSLGIWFKPTHPHKQTYMHMCTCRQEPISATKWRQGASNSTIAWNSDVLTTAARLCVYLAQSYVTTATEATVHKCTTSTDLTFYNCRIWSIAENRKFLFRILLFSAVGCSLAPLRRFAALMGS